MQAAKPAREDMVLGHGVQKTAGSHIKANDAGKYSAEQRNAQNNQTGLAEDQTGRIKGGERRKAGKAFGQGIFGAIGNIRHPTGIAFGQDCGRDGIEDDIKSAAEQEGYTLIGR